jgi:hypothetical protein
MRIMCHVLFYTNTPCFKNSNKLRMNVLICHFLTAASMKIIIFWNVSTYSLVAINRRFRGAYCIQHQTVLMMEAVSASETSVDYYQTYAATSQKCHLHTVRALAVCVCVCVCQNMRLSSMTVHLKSVTVVSVQNVFFRVLLLFTVGLSILKMPYKIRPLSLCSVNVRFYSCKFIVSDWAFFLISVRSVLQQRYIRTLSEVI